MKLSEASTIYQYKLLRRIPIHKHHVMAYAALMLIAVLLFILIEQSFMQVISMMLSYILMHFIYTCITLLDLAVRDKQQLHNWKWSMQFPWLGWLPVHVIPLQSFILVHVNLSIIGLALIIGLLPWITPLFFVQLLFLHVWILLPRLLIMLQPLPRNCLIKLERVRISLYQS